LSGACLFEFTWPFEYKKFEYFELEIQVSLENYIYLTKSLQGEPICFSDHSTAGQLVYENSFLHLQACVFEMVFK